MRYSFFAAAAALTLSVTGLNAETLRFGHAYEATEAFHIRALEAVKAAIPDIVGRPLPINVNGAIPAVMLDVGFPLGALKGISLLARTASLIGHLQEETERPIGFILSGKAADAITYDGPDIEE